MVSADWTHTHTHTHTLPAHCTTNIKKQNFFLFGNNNGQQDIFFRFFYDKVLVFNSRAWIQNLILSHQAFTLLCWDSNYVSAEVYTCITSLFNKVKDVTYMNSLVLPKRSWKQFWKIIDQQSMSIQGKAMFLFSLVIFLWSAFRSCQPHHLLTRNPWCTRARKQLLLALCFNWHLLVFQNMVYD